MRKWLFILLPFCLLFGFDLSEKQVAYPNGKPKEKYAFYLDKQNNEIRQGHYISWYENGKNEEEGWYKNNKKDSVWQKWDIYGVKTSDARWENGIQEGLCIEYNEGGSECMRGNYVNGKKNGKWTSPNRLDQGSYVDGKKEGKWQESIEGSDMGEDCVIHGNYLNNKKEGVWRKLCVSHHYTSILCEKLLYKNDTLRKTDQCDSNMLPVFKKDDKPTKKQFTIGKDLLTHEKKYSNGNLQERYTYYQTSDSFVFLDGQYLQWYENGKKMVEGRFKKGGKDSVWQEWNENGIILKKENWKKGRKNGLSITWSQEGDFCDSGIYINNKKEGEWIESKKGDGLEEYCKIKGNYKDDKKEGIWTKYCFDAHHTAIQCTKLVYQNDSLIKTNTCDSTPLPVIQKK